MAARLPKRPRDADAEAGSVLPTMAPVQETRPGKKHRASGVSDASSYARQQRCGADVALFEVDETLRLLHHPGFDGMRGVSKPRSKLERALRDQSALLRECFNAACDAHGNLSGSCSAYGVHLQACAYEGWCAAMASGSGYGLVLAFHHLMLPCQIMGVVGRQSQTAR